MRWKWLVAIAGACVWGLLAPVAGAAVAQSVVVSSVPAKSTPQVLDGRVQAIIQVGNTIIVGGKFTQVRLPKGAIVARKNLFAFDATTGAISTTFVPTVAGGSVFTLQAGADGASVIVGGKFTSVDGKAQAGLARVELANGARDATFTPRVSHGAVLSSALSGGHLYLAGTFTKIGGVPMTGLAEVDAVTGALEPDFDFTLGYPTNGNLQAGHLAISPDGDSLVVSGTFTTVDGQSRIQIAMIDLTTSPATLAPWTTQIFDPSWVYGQSMKNCEQNDGGNVRNIDFAPDGSYFVLATTGSGAGDCDSVIRFETDPADGGQMPTWVDHSGGDSITDVAVTGTAIYAGGHQRWMEGLSTNGAIPREGIAALDPVNGMPFSWNPGRSPRGTGVYAFLATATGLWIGGDSTYTAGKYHPRLAFFPTAGGTMIPAVQVPNLPGQLGSVSSAGLSLSSFDGTTPGASSVLSSQTPWQNAGGTFMVNGTLYAFTTDGNFVAAPFDGHSLGAAQQLPLFGDTLDIASVTGAFYDPASGLLYYTVLNDTALYVRYFEPQDGLLNAVPQIVTRFPTGVAAMTRVGSNIVFVDQNGNLDEVSFAGGALGSQITTLSGPGTDGHDWTGTRGLFISPN